MKNIGLILIALVIILSACENMNNMETPSMTYSPAIVEESCEAEGMAYDDEEELIQLNDNNSLRTSKKVKATQSPTDKTAKLIKDGSLTMTSTDISKSKIYMDSLVSAHNAYYERDNYHASEYRLTYNLNIRIPASNFEAFLSLSESSHHLLTSKNISARDVTEEYIDLEIRLDNNNAYLKRYNQLLAKANTVKDMLQIQEKTRQISAEIEGIKGRLKYLDDKVGYSTLTIQIEQFLSPVERSTTRNFSNQIINSLKGGFNGMLDFILVVTTLWPVLIGLIIFLFYRKNLWSKLSTVTKKNTE